MGKVKSTLKIVGLPTMTEEIAYPDPSCVNMIIDIVVEGTYGDITFGKGCTVALDVTKDPFKIKIPCDYIHGDYTTAGEDEMAFWDHPTKWDETVEAIIKLCEDVPVIKDFVTEQLEFDALATEDDYYKEDPSDRDDWVPGLGVYMGDGEYTTDPWW